MYVKWILGTVKNYLEHVFISFTEYILAKWQENEGRSF